MDGIFTLLKGMFWENSGFRLFKFNFKALDIYIRYWYKILNVNCNELNNSLYEHDSIKLSKAPIKNQLSEEEKAIMLKNGYNNKYIVSGNFIEKNLLFKKTKKKIQIFSIFFFFRL